MSGRAVKELLCCTPCGQHCQGHVPSAERCWVNPPCSPELSLWQYSGFSNRPEKNVRKQVYSELYLKSKVFCIHTVKLYGGLRCSFTLINLNNRWKWSASYPSHLTSTENAPSTYSMGCWVSSRSDLNALQKKPSLVSA